MHVSLNVITSLPAQGHDHDPALAALLFLPVAVVLLFVAIEALHGLGIGAASRMRAGYQSLTAATRFGLLLVAMTAWIHLALAPGHWAEDPFRAVLFVIDGLGLGAVTFLALYRVAWRPYALALLGLSVLAYPFYVISGREDIDAVGIFTKAVEVAALVLIMAGRAGESEFNPSIPGPARTSNPSEVTSR